MGATARWTVGSLPHKQSVPNFNDQWPLNELLRSKRGVAEFAGWAGCVYITQMYQVLSKRVPAHSLSRFKQRKLKQNKNQEVSSQQRKRRQNKNQEVTSRAIRS